MNPYEILGVDPGVSDSELSSVYKKLAKKYHPDLNPDDEAAARKMGEINQAYDRIRTMRQRAEQYSRYGHQQSRSGRQAYGNASTGGFGTDWQVYYKKPRLNVVVVILAAVVTMLLARLLLSIVFGEYSDYFYRNYGSDYGAYPYVYGTETDVNSVPEYGYYSENNE